MHLSIVLFLLLIFLFKNETMSNSRMKETKNSFFIVVEVTA